MPLSQFIRDHHLQIIDSFEAFARTRGPVTADMSAIQLRDHAQELLTEIVADMESEQSREEQTQKSEGVGTRHAMQTSGRPWSARPCGLIRPRPPLAPAVLGLA